MGSPKGYRHKVVNYKQYGVLPSNALCKIQKQKVIEKQYQDI